MREVVIRINEETYNDLRYQKQYNPRFLSHYERMILDGILLPKGHGRLIDADKLLDANIDTFSQQTELKIKFAPTIIDKEW